MKRLRLTVQKCTIWVTWLGIIFSAQAQNTGELSGYVRDAKTEEVLIGVSVRLEGTDLGSVTDINGYYAIKNVPAKSYNVVASYVGYQSRTRYNVVVKSAGTPNINFNLQESVDELSEIVVTASPFQKELETPNSIQRLSPEEIATYPGGNNDIAKVVQSLPGVSGSVGGFRNDVIIRGGAPNENVYYLDGVEIPNINHFSTQGSAGGPVGLLNVSFFEGVTLNTSSFPAQYDNALSGVIQFDQRNGDPRRRRTNIRVSGSEAALTLEGPLIKPKEENELAKTTYIVSARRSYLQFLFQLIGLPFLPDYWDYQYKVNHKIGKYDELNLIGVGSIDNFRVNIPDDITAEQQATLDQVPIIKQWSSTVGISWKHRFRNGTGFTRTTLSGNILNNDFSRYEDTENQEGLILSNKSVEDENKLRFEMTNFVGDWTFTSGALMQYSRYENTTTNVVNDFNFTSELNFFRYGLFYQVAREFGRLSGSVGFRVDGNTFTDEGNNVLRTFSPRASLSYQLDKASRWSVNASLGRYFKIPPYTILGFQDNNRNYVNQGSNYTRSDHMVAGVEFLPRRSTRFTVEGFLKLYSNYPLSVTDSVSLANLGGDFSVLGSEPVETIGKGRAYGVEFLYQQKLSKNFYGILAYTLYWSEFTGFDTNEYLPSSWDNRHLLSFTGGYKLPNNWEIGTRFRFLGRAPFPPVNAQASEEVYPTLVLDYSNLGEERLDSFNQLDIRVDKKWNFNNWTLNLFLEVTNVLGTQIPGPPSYGLERNDAGNIIQPRNLVQITEVDNSSPLPTLGIIVDF